MLSMLRLPYIPYLAYILYPGHNLHIPTIPEHNTTQKHFFILKCQLNLENIANVND